jgi:hypothetical protein
MRGRPLAAAAAAFGLSGCYTLQGPPQIVNSQGVVNQTEAVTAPSDNLRSNFRFYVDQSATDRSNTSKSTQMLESGFLLVRTNCDYFFWEMSRQQRISRITRDSVAPIVTILTGVIGLVDFGTIASQSEAIEILSLASGASISALDVYDEHFLFGAENIHEVRTLVVRALSTHREAVLAQPPMQFEAAVMQLVDHQAICTPGSILRLTRRAIAVGEVVPADTGSGQQALALFRLGQALGLGRSLTPLEAEALKRALAMPAPADAELRLLTTQLQGLGDRNPIAVSQNVHSVDRTRLGANAAEVVRILDSLVPSQTAAARVAAAALATDQNVLAELGRALGAGRDLTVDEAQALWQAAKGSPTQELRNRLSALPTNPVTPTGATFTYAAPAAPGAGAISGILNRLQPETKALFDRGLAALYTGQVPAVGNPSISLDVQ